MKHRRLIYKLLLLMTVVVCCQISLYALVPQTWLSFPVFTTLQKIIRGGKSNVLLFFGDSTIATTFNADRDKSSIAQMLSQESVGYPVSDLSCPGYSASIYLALTKYFLEAGGSSPLMIFPINLRTLDEKGSGMVSTGFKREKTLLAYANDPLIFPFVHASMVFRPQNGMSAPTNRELDLTRVVATESGVNVYRYDFVFEKDAAEFDALRRLLGYLRAKKQPALFYLTPLNASVDSQRLPASFKEGVRRNTNFVQSEVTRAGFPAVDLTFSVEPGDFTNTEHLKEKGRRKVARSLAGRIKKMDSVKKENPAR